MLTLHFDDTQAHVIACGTHKPICCKGLLCLSLLLGWRLLETIRIRLISELKSERFLPDHALATEAVNSPYYRTDGYWRAPRTLLLSDNIESCGEHTFAPALVYKFCDMAVHSGFVENNNTISGDGLRDRAYIWTSSVFLIFSRSMHNKTLIGHPYRPPAPMPLHRPGGFVIVILSARW